MTMHVGGLRARLLRESLFNMLNEALDDLGWFAAGRKHEPIVFRSTQLKHDEEVTPNTAVLVDFGAQDTSWELGSTFRELRWTFYVDFYAENEAVGVHFSRDVVDVLGGHIGAIGRSDPSVVVYDYTQATPTAIFTCPIEDVMVDRATVWERPWQQFWYAVRFDVLDSYGNEDY